MVKLKAKELFEFILILFLFEPNIFVKYKLLNALFICGGVISFFYITILRLTHGRKFYKLTLLIIFWRILLILQTLSFNGDILKVGYQSMIIVALFLYGEYFHNMDKLDKLIKILVIIFFTYLLLNLLLYLVFPNGIINNGLNIYFLGIRTRFTEYALTLILLTIIYYRTSKKSHIVFLLTSIGVALLNIVIFKISTAFIGIFVFVFMYFVFLKCKINYNFLCVFTVLISILVVFFRIQNYFEFILVLLFNKTATLSFRTTIWNSSYKYIFDKNILLGHGMSIDGNFVKIKAYKELCQAHNQLLQSLFENGLIGTIIFYGVIMIALQKLYHNFSNKNNKLIASCIIAFLIMMITEIYSFYIPFYVLILLGYFSDKINVEKRTIENEIR